MKNTSSKYIFSIKIAVRVFIGAEHWRRTRWPKATHRLAGELDTVSIYSAYKSLFCGKETGNRLIIRTNQGSWRMDQHS